MGEGLSLAGVGDNTTDIYLSTCRCYPGGNALNVAVFASRLGMKSAYVGVVGKDSRGRLVAEALEAEGVDIERVRRSDMPNSFTLVDHEEGDRVFVGSDPSTSQALRLEREDFDYLSGFGHIHTSIFSTQEAMLPELRKAAGSLSYDFSDKFDDRKIETVLPHVDYAFFSLGAAGRDEVDRFFLKWGDDYVSEIVVTAGDAGSYARRNGEIVHEPARKIEPIDTIGAGDAFIAHYLAAGLEGVSVKESLALATEAAKKTCMVEGSFGYGTTLEEEEVVSLRNCLSRIRME